MGRKITLLGPEIGRKRTRIDVDRTPYAGFVPCHRRLFFFFSLDSNFDLLFRLSEGYLRRTESVAELTMEEEKD